MKLYRLDAAALRLAPKADDFLRAYTTQVPTSARGAFIDTKGRAVAVYDLIRLGSDDAVLVVSRGVLDRLFKHLKVFLTLTGSALEVLPHAVYWDIEKTAASFSAESPGANEWVVPRSAGQIWVTARPVSAVVGEEDFCRFRLTHGLAIQGVDYDDPMLLNLNDSELVSFDKGCYLGQEIMARVHYRGKPPLRLSVVRESDCPPHLRSQMTSRFYDVKTGETMGFAFLPAAD